MGPDTRRGRRALDRDELQSLADICGGLGDHGLAVRFGGWDRAAARPRVYEDLVNQAAERHGVDPGLLLAVMRVESVYNPRIISYAGAIGLMQIMPRTGGFIARQVGQQDFTVDRLLEPETNIDFSAWYLASLIDRFDGRVPLAVASYSGGPHNVRLWLHGHSPDIPLDAFLETIPLRPDAPLRAPRAHPLRGIQRPARRSRSRAGPDSPQYRRRQDRLLVPPGGCRNSVRVDRDWASDDTRGQLCTFSFRPAKHRNEPRLFFAANSDCSRTEH